VQASVQKMAPKEAADHAFAIVKLYVALDSLGERVEQLKVVGGAKQPPPRYLAKRP
jgi:hypothetical protein